MIKVTDVIKYVKELKETVKESQAILMGDCNCQKCRDKRFAAIITADVLEPIFQYTNGPVSVLNLDDYNYASNKGWPTHTSSAAVEERLHSFFKTLLVNEDRHTRVPTKRQAFCRDCGKLCNSKYLHTVNYDGVKQGVCAECRDLFYDKCGFCGSYTKKCWLRSWRKINKLKKNTVELVCHDCLHTHVHCMSCKGIGTENMFSPDHLPNGRPVQQQPNRQRVRLNRVRGEMEFFEDDFPADPPEPVPEPAGPERHPSHFEQNRVCKRCLPDIYTKCDVCKDKVLRWDIIEKYDEDGHKERMCGPCSIHRVPMHDFNYKPPTLTWLYDKDTEHMSGRLLNNRLWFGVEFEFNRSEEEDNRIRNRIIQRCKDYFNPGEIYCTYDGTIRNGFELVTMPMTHAWFKKHVSAFDSMLKYVRTKGYFGDDPNCGGHIHMSKTAFTSFHIYKFCNFIYKPEHRKFIKVLSQRGGQFSNNMAYFSEDDQSETGLKYAAKNKRFPSNNHHSALSFQGSDSTLEARFFAGYSKVEDLQKNIEFLQSLYFFSKNTPPNAATLRNYVKYVTARSNRNQYYNLINFMFRNKKTMGLEFTERSLNIIKRFLKKGGDK
jgi:hypothetical protein